MCYKVQGISPQSAMNPTLREFLVDDLAVPLNALKIVVDNPRSPQDAVSFRSLPQHPVVMSRGSSERQRRLSGSLSSTSTSLGEVPSRWSTEIRSQPLPRQPSVDRGQRRLPRRTRSLDDLFPVIDFTSKSSNSAPQRPVRRGGQRRPQSPPSAPSKSTNISPVPLRMPVRQQSRENIFQGGNKNSLPHIPLKSEDSAVTMSVSNMLSLEQTGRLQNRQQQSLNLFRRSTTSLLSSQGQITVNSNDSDDSPTSTSLQSTTKELLAVACDEVSRQRSIQQQQNSSLQAKEWEQ